MPTRLVLSILLAAATGTCAGRVPAPHAMPQPGIHHPSAPLATEAADWERYARALPAGARVRVVLTDGTRFTATLLGVEEQDLVLQRATRVPEAPRRVPAAHLAALARDEGGIGIGKAALIGLGVRSLSVSPRAVPLMKRLVRSMSAETTAAAADAACASRTAADAEACVRESLRAAVADDAALRSGLLGLLELSKVTSAGDA